MDVGTRSRCVILKRDDLSTLPREGRYNRRYNNSVAVWLFISRLNPRVGQWDALAV